MKIFCFALLVSMCTTSLLGANIEHELSEIEENETIINTENLYYRMREKLLITACQNNDFNRATLLIKQYGKYFDINLYNQCLLKTGYTGSEKVNKNLVKLLIDNKADINYRKNNTTFTLLHSSCYDINVPLARFLLENSADVNAVELNYYSDEEDENAKCITVSYSLDLVFTGLNIRNNKEKDALELIKYLLLNNALYSEENSENELLITARQDILEENTKAWDSI